MRIRYDTVGFMELILQFCVFDITVAFWQLVILSCDPQVDEVTDLLASFTSLSIQMQNMEDR